MKVYYVKSTGKVISQEYTGIGKMSKKRQNYGNLFTDLKHAKRASKLIRFALKFVGGKA